MVVTADSTFVFSDGAINPSTIYEDHSFKDSGWIAHTASSVDIEFAIETHLGAADYYLDEVIVELGSDTEFEDANLLSSGSRYSLRELVESSKADKNFSNPSTVVGPIVTSVGAKETLAPAPGKFSTATVELFSSADDTLE